MIFAQVFSFLLQCSSEKCVTVHTTNDLVFLTNMETVNPGRDRVICITVISGVLATVAVLLRFVARRRSKASFAADDWWIAATLIPSYGMLAVGLISTFVVPAFHFDADELSDHEWRRWPTFRHVNRKPNGNVLEGRLRGRDTFP